MERPRRAVRVIEVIVVVMALAGVAALLLPTLRSAKMSAIRASLEKQVYDASGELAGAGQPADKGLPLVQEAPPRMLAQVKTFQAVIVLTPGLSVGTARPESIYEARFEADIEAVSPAEGRTDCEVQLPLPPQIISLSDLTVTVNGEPSDDLDLRDGMLLWHGQLDAARPVPLKVNYSAVGKGIYTLRKPPGKIVDTFEAKLTAKHTNVQMLELSLQPVDWRHQSGDTVYEWKYSRLMLARPIALDVLGIAPMDRLGELGWLGPVSVLVFGILAALVTMAFCPARLDKWMLLLIVGAFTGAYPLMYFAQEFTTLTAAMAGSAALVLVIIGVRAVTLMGPKVGVLGVVALAAAVLVVTLWAALEPKMQGVLLTGMAIGAFVLAMILLPRAQKSLASETPAPPAVPPPPGDSAD